MKPQSCKTPPTQMPVPPSRSVIVPQATYNLYPTWLQIGVLITPSSSYLIIYYNRELSEKLTFTGLLREMIKDAFEQLDEKIHRARAGRAPTAGASVSVKLGCTTFQYVDVLTNLEAL